MGITLEQLSSAIGKVKDYVNNKFPVVSPNKGNAIISKENGIFVEDKQPQIDKLKEDFDGITKIQKYINMDLDYAYFKGNADWTTVSGDITKYFTIGETNMNIDTNNCITLKADKKYLVICEVLSATKDSYIYIECSGTKASTTGCHNDTYQIQASALICPSEDTLLKIITNDDNNICFNHSNLRIQEIGREKIIDSGTGTTGTSNNINYIHALMYSKEEKVVGSWINGKPLYQKTIVTQIPEPSKQNTIIMPNTNVDDVINFNSSFTNGIVINTAPNINGANYLNFWYNKEDNLLYITCTEKTWSNRRLYLTIQYTKTTDEENSFIDSMVDYLIPSIEYGQYTDQEITDAINALW